MSIESQILDYAERTHPGIRSGLREISDFAWEGNPNVPDIRDIVRIPVGLSFDSAFDIYAMQRMDAEGGSIPGIATTVVADVAGERIFAPIKA